MTVDTHDNTYHAYFITFTTSCSEWPEDVNDRLIGWHVAKCDQALLVAEGGPDEDKHLHFHSVATFKARAAKNVTEQVKTLYKKMGLPVTGRSIQVKKVTDLVGIWHYHLKELGDRKPLLLKGWKMSFIKESCLANLKKIPHKVLLKNKYMLNAKIATALMVEYAAAKSLVISGKESFTTVVCEMAKEGYQFESVKIKWLYTQVMSLMGDERPMRKASNQTV